MHLSFAAMEILAAAAVEDIGDADLALQCALLHDVLEDTMVPREKLRAEFGEAVTEGVLALTLKKRLPGGADAGVPAASASSPARSGW
jgi:(p)ppGpp synthase/HD superfamily hydrolase